jgi:hypothetical protein
MVASMLMSARGAARALRVLAILVVAAFALLPAAELVAAPRTLSCAYLEAGPAGPVGNILTISGTDNALVRREGDRIAVGTTDAANGPRGFEEIACGGAPATVFDVDRVDYLATPLADEGLRQFILDERTGRLAPGADPESAGSEIEVELHFARADRGIPNVQVLGTPEPDSFHARPLSGNRFGVNLNLGAEQTQPDADLILTAPPGRIDFKLHGEGGPDSIDARPADRSRVLLRSLLLSGDEGGDTLFGTSRRDWLEGGEGSDRLFGRGGADFLYPGAGRDRVYGGAGDDLISAAVRGGERDHQHDFYSGGAGEDFIISRVGGRDTVRCGSGFDQANADSVDDLGGGRCEDLSGTAARSRLFARSPKAAPPSPLLRPGNAGHIVYANHGRLKSVPARGGTPRTLAAVPAGTLDLAASRDGSRIALISNQKLKYPQRGSVRSIYLFRPGHGIIRLRRFHATAPLDIAISPNGRWIAFGRASEIWLMRSDGSGVRQATAGPSVAWDPAFAPDGRSLVFNRDARSGPQLFRRPLAGGPEVQLSEDGGRNPAISSNGLLLYTRFEEGATDSRLIVMRLDGSRRHTVERFNDPYFDLSAAFSPDGRSIAYLRLWEKNGYAVNYRYSIHTKTAAGRRHRKVIGGLRSSARSAPFAGHAPAGPVWVPW